MTNGKFRRLFPKEGLWFRYKGPSAFEGMLRQQLTNYLRNRYPVSKPEPQPVATVAALADELRDLKEARQPGPGRQLTCGRGHGFPLPSVA